MDSQADGLVGDRVVGMAGSQTGKQRGRQSHRLPYINTDTQKDTDTAEKST